MLSLKLKSCFVFVLLFISIFSRISAQLCDSGDLATTCTVSSPKTFTESQSFNGESIVINANITCVGCSLGFYMTQDISLSGGGVIAGLDVNLSCNVAQVSANSNIIVEINGTLWFYATELTMSGRIEGSYLNLEIQNTFTLNGLISADGYGYATDSGPGSGSNGDVGQAGGGAGYGWHGGYSCSDVAGGLVYGTQVNPTALGSGGGYADNFRNNGGSGGGFIGVSAGQLILNVNGNISANGVAGQSGTGTYPDGAGGGSGGSIILRTGSITFVGGFISANGGDGGRQFRTGLNPSGKQGGKGAGGRIYVNSTIPLTYGAYGIHISVNQGTGCTTDDYHAGSMFAACGAGKQTYQYGCRDCGVGYYSINGSCIRCPIGTYSNVTGATNASTCLDCPVGYYSLYTTGSCTRCNAGTFSNTSGSSDCFECPPGHISPSASSNCSICPAGTYTTTYGRVSCFRCANGSISEPGTSGSCTLCGLGSISLDNKCEVCPNNTQHYSSSNDCRKCSAGAFSAGNTTACRQCPAGTYGPSVGYGCVECEPGWYNYWSARTYCTRCPRGSYSPNSTFCEYCPSGTYNNALNATSCIPCPPGEEAGSGSVVCSPPYVNYGTSSFSSSARSTPGSINWTAFQVGLPVGIIGAMLLIVAIVLIVIFVKRRKSNSRPRPSLAFQAPHYNPEPYELEEQEKEKKAKKMAEAKRERELVMAKNKNEQLDKHNFGSSSSSSAPSAPPPLNPEFTAPSAPPAESAADEPNEGESAGSCIVCYERPKQIVFLPCGHVATCVTCATGIMSEANAKCPICRSIVQTTTRVYL